MPQEETTRHQDTQKTVHYQTLVVLYQPGPLVKTEKLPLRIVSKNHVVIILHLLFLLNLLSLLVLG